MVIFSVYLNRCVFVMRSVVVLLCVSAVLCVVFVLSLFDPHLSFYWCLGSAMLRDCGISWVSVIIFFIALPGLREPDILFRFSAIFFLFLTYLCRLAYQARSE